jgi:hypothetical protein
MKWLKTLLFGFPEERGLDYKIRLIDRDILEYADQNGRIIISATRCMGDYHFVIVLPKQLVREPPDGGRPMSTTEQSEIENRLFAWLERRRIRFKLERRDVEVPVTIVRKGENRP